MLAGAEQCLGSVLPVSSAIPLYGLVTSVIAAAVLSKGMKALKIANVISITLAVADCNAAVYQYRKKRFLANKKYRRTNLRRTLYSALRCLSA